MGNITRNQWFAIGILLCTVVTGGTAQLTDLIGTVGTKTLVSLCTLITGLLAGVQVILGGQGQQVLDVKNMPGVEKIDINDKANQVLAKMALDPTVDKVGIAPGDSTAVLQTAKGNT